MANVTITIPDAQVDRVRDAVAARNGYNQAIHGTKNQFYKNWLIQKTKDEVKDYEGNSAAASARSAAIADVESINIT